MTACSENRKSIISTVADMAALQILKKWVVAAGCKVYQARNALRKGNSAVYEDHNKSGDSVLLYFFQTKNRPR